jgi:hypothetical protein
MLPGVPLPVVDRYFDHVFFLETIQSAPFQDVICVPFEVSAGTAAMLVVHRTQHPTRAGCGTNHTHVAFDLAPYCHGFQGLFVRIPG